MTALSTKEVHLTLRAVLLSVAGLPTPRVFDNVKFTPTVGVPYVLEGFAPSTTQLYTTSPNGLIESRGLYLVQWFGLQGAGISAIRDGTDAILAAFPPGAGLPMTSGLITRIRGDQAPFASQILQLDGGWAYVTVTIPWQVFWSKAA